MFSWCLENSPVTLFRGKIMLLHLPCLLFSLRISQAIDQPFLRWSHSIIIKASLGAFSYRITMFTCETKRYELYRIHFHTNCWCGAELYRTVGAKLEQRIRIHAKRYKHNRNPIWKGTRYRVNRALVCRFRPIKSALSQDSQIFRMHIPLNNEIWKLLTSNAAANTK